MTTRIYYVKHASGTSRLIRADTKMQAVGFAARTEFSCEVADQETLVQLAGTGMPVEDARKAQQELPVD